MTPWEVHQALKAELARIDADVDRTKHDPIGLFYLGQRSALTTALAMLSTCSVLDR